ncbi:MAG: hypothetical protein H8D23_24615 [Candidatus Brocadiales bacterium]|nr:hypothetical protein [Candidatus Brocadiales bacterium]
MKIKPVQGIFEPFLPSYSRRLGNTIFKPSPDQEGWVRARTDKGYIFPQFKDGLTANLFADHVNDNICLGFRAAESVNLFVLDFDNHGGGPARQREINEQFFKSLVYFERSAIGFRSSDSGGIHLYVFLNDFIRLEDMQPIVKHYLKILNLPENTEIYPNANRGQRLPFGKGSRPLPAGIDMLINKSKIDQMNWFLDWFNNDCEPLDVERLHAIRQQIHADQKATSERRRAKKYKGVKPSTNTDHAPGEIKSLLREGIPPKYDRYKTFVSLTRYFMHKHGHDTDKTREALKTFIRDKNNGNSAGYNKDPHEFYRFIDRIVDGFDAKKSKPVRPISGDRFLFLSAIQNITKTYGTLIDDGCYVVALGLDLLRGNKKTGIKGSMFLKGWGNCRIQAFKDQIISEGLLEKIKNYFVGESYAQYIVSRELMEFDQGNFQIYFHNVDEFKRFVNALGVRRSSKLLDVSASTISRINTGKYPIPERLQSVSWFVEED